MTPRDWIDIGYIALYVVAGSNTYIMYQYMMLKIETKMKE